MKHKLESRLLGEISNTSDMCMTPPLWQSEGEPTSLLMKVKQGSKKVGLKLSIQKTKVMAPGPITSWEIDGETVADFIFLGSKSLQMVIAAIKWEDAYSLKGNLWPTRQHIKKQRRYFVNKGLSSQGYFFQVVMYGCESWTIKKAERWRIDAFEL